MSITLQIGPSATARENFIADIVLPADADTSGGWEIADGASGEVARAQLDRVEGAPRASFHVSKLGADETRSFELRPATQDHKDNGIELIDQPENGRVVVYYGGLLQTIYHYGMPNYRPYFAPNVAPSGRPNSGVGSTDGSQPK